MVAEAARDAAEASTRDRPLLAATMFGVTTPAVTAVRERLERAGFDVLVFHATGAGGRAMEGLIDDGYVDGVVDVTTTEWCDEVVGGVLSAGPDRLGAAARAGHPAGRVGRRARHGELRRHRDRARALSQPGRCTGTTTRSR